MVIAVLAVQGAFAEHEQMLEKLNIPYVELRKKDDLLQKYDGIILPGGESTVQGKLLKELDMFDTLREQILGGMPVMATCAGLILLANRLSNDEREYFKSLDVVVKRNAYGRQLGSFFIEEECKGIGKIPMTFIRAPYIEKVGSGVEVLAMENDHIVAVREKNQLGMAFHPELDQDETDFLRQGVEGGITYATPKFQFIDIHQKIYHIDIHQAHPFSAWKYIYPYGEGEYFTGPAPRGKISACRIRIGYDGVYLHSVIKLIGLDYIEDYELVVWDFEIAVMKKCYKNLRIKYIDGYAYKMRFLPWRNYYSQNYLKRLDAKKKGDDFNTMRYKLLNNSSYGKMLEKPHNDIMLNTVNSLGIIDSIVEDKPENECKVNAKYTYLPVGSSIPARTRCYLVSTALKFSPDGSKIIYFDTDSIFILWDEEVEKIWKSPSIQKEDWLGGWALEETLGHAQFTAPKRYKTEDLFTKKVSIKAGGINFDKYFEEKGISQNEIPFDEINITNETYKVQRAMRVKGGSIVIFQDKTMSVQKKYKDIFEKNTKKK